MPRVTRGPPTSGCATNARRRPKPGLTGGFDDAGLRRDSRGRVGSAFLVAALVLLVLAVGGGTRLEASVLFTSEQLRAELRGREPESVSERPVRRAARRSTPFVRRSRPTASSIADHARVLRDRPRAADHRPDAVAGNVEAKSGQVITVTVSDGVQTVSLPTNLIGETCSHGDGPADEPARQRAVSGLADGLELDDAASDASRAS